MGLGRAVLFILGLGSLALHLWPVAIFCFAVLLYSFRPRKRGSQGARQVPVSMRLAHVRAIAAAALLLLTAVAAATGGPYQVFALLFFAAVLPWSSIFSSLVSSRLVPVVDTILLRPALFPLCWHALAEVKPGSGPLPRALSSYEGRLIFTNSGKAFSHVRTFALGSSSAEARVLLTLRQAAAGLASEGAYLMPLDGEAAAKVLSSRLRKVRPAHRETLDLGADVLVTESREGFLTRAGAYHSLGPSSSSSVPRSAGLRQWPLLWETLEGAAKRRRLPESDPFSNLLESFAAAKGEPIGERLDSLEDAGETMTVQALSGDRMQVTRSQLRALAGVYP